MNGNCFNRGETDVGICLRRSFWRRSHKLTLPNMINRVRKHLREPPWQGSHSIHHLVSSRPRPNGHFSSAVYSNRSRDSQLPLVLQKLHGSSGFKWTSDILCKPGRFAHTSKPAMIKAATQVDAAQSLSVHEWTSATGRSCCKINKHLPWHFFPFLVLAIHHRHGGMGCPLPPALFHNRLNLFGTCCKVFFFSPSGLPTSRRQAAASNSINHAVGTCAASAALSGLQFAPCNKQVSKRGKI